MMWLAGRTVFELVLVVLTVVFLMVVALAAAATAWLSRDQAPEFLRDASGAVLPFGRRMLALAREGVRRGSARPWRTPESIVASVAAQMAKMAWSSPQGWIAYSNLRVSMHPDTLARLDGWMAVEHVAGQWARGYADRRKRTRRLSDTVHLVVAADARAPTGAWRVVGSFQPNRSPEVVAEATAALSGPRAEAPAPGMRRPAAAPDAADRPTEQWRPGTDPGPR
jgi:hypothetical protein